MVELVQPGHRVGEAIVQDPLDEVERGDGPAVQVDRPEHRLERVGQDRCLRPPAGPRLALAEQQPVTELEAAGDGRERCRVDHALAQVGQLPLGHVGVAAVDEVGHRPAEHGISEELEPLVRLLAGRLRAPAAVRHGATQQSHVVELVAEPLAERFEVGRGGSLGGCRRADRQLPWTRSRT